MVVAVVPDWAGDRGQRSELAGASTPSPWLLASPCARASTAGRWSWLCGNTSAPHQLTTQHLLWHSKWSLQMYPFGCRRRRAVLSAGPQPSFQGLPSEPLAPHLSPAQAGHTFFQDRHCWNTVTGVQNLLRVQAVGDTAVALAFTVCLTGLSDALQSWGSFTCAPTDQASLQRLLSISNAFSSPA